MRQPSQYLHREKSHAKEREEDLALRLRAPTGPLQPETQGHVLGGRYEISQKEIAR